MNIRLLAGVTALVAVMFFTACTNEDTDFGQNLTDPSAWYNGTLCDTVSVSAYTLREDSMSTYNYMNGVIGVLQNSVFGKTEAVMYTQAALSTTGGISFESDIIDSVVVSLAITSMFSTDTKDSNYIYSARIAVQPLAEALSDSIYYACNEVAAAPETYFDQTVAIKAKDTVVRMKMNSSIEPIFSNKVYGNNEDFLEALKGLKISLIPQGADADNMMMCINYAASATGLTVYFHSNNDTIPLEYSFVFSGTSAKHFNGYKHTYTSSPLSVFNSNVGDSVPGLQKLYLQPLGGTFLKLRFPYLQQWSAQHPNAVVHQAQIIMPVADETSAIGEVTQRVLCYKYLAGGKVMLIPDMMDALLAGGFDGYYNKDKKQYRMRITRHIQQVVSGAPDYGLAIYIDARRVSAKQVILKGTDKSLAEHVKLEIIYSETK